jgi:hypothetical protein
MNPRVSSLAANGAAALALLWPTTRADAHPLVRLDIDPCAGVAAADVRRAIAIELTGALAEPTDVTPDATRVAVVCTGELVELRVDDPITGKSLQRMIDLREAPDARPRLLALAIVELVTASWTELDTNPDPKVPPAGPRASPEVREAALATVHEQTPAPARSRTRLVALAGGMGWFSGTGVLAGGGVRLIRDDVRHVGWITDVMAHHGSARVSVGSVDIDALSAGAMLAQHAWPSFGFHLGLGVRSGAVHLRGKPDPAEMLAGHAGWAPWGGVVGLVSVALPATSHLVIDLGAESGYVVLPAGALVDRMRELAVEGAWIGIHAGIQIF